MSIFSFYLLLFRSWELELFYLHAMPCSKYLLIKQVNSCNSMRQLAFLYRFCGQKLVEKIWVQIQKRYEASTETYKLYSNLQQVWIHFESTVFFGDWFARFCYNLRTQIKKKIDADCNLYGIFVSASLRLAGRIRNKYFNDFFSHFHTYTLSIAMLLATRNLQCKMRFGNRTRSKCWDVVFVGLVICVLFELHSIKMADVQKSKWRSHWKLIVSTLLRISGNSCWNIIHN